MAHWSCGELWGGRLVLDLLITQSKDPCSRTNSKMVQQQEEIRQIEYTHQKALGFRQLGKCCSQSSHARCGIAMEELPLSERVEEV